MRSEPFGTTPDGTTVERYTLEAGGLRVRILTYGGIVQTLEAPDRHGELANVVLGFPTLSGYLDNAPYFGALIGRYANRIADARFPLDGVLYDVPANQPPNSLHGGADGFDKWVWRAAPGADGATLGLTLASPDGDQGFPGELTVDVTYAVTAEAELRIDYRATTDRPTVVNLTNHSYLNLDGEGSGDCYDHVLQIVANSFTPVGPTLIPTGELAPVAGTPLDFRTPTPIGARRRDDVPQLRYGNGYDHNWVLDGGGSPAARLHAPRSGRTLEVRTDEPGLQFYAGNGLDGSIIGTGGRPYGPGSGVALETQHFPDSPNQPAFPSTVLRPGEVFSSTTTYRFSA